MWNRQLETLSLSEITALQLERLQSVVERVSRCVPFYTNALTVAAVNSSTIKSLDDLQRLPFTSKSDLRDNYPLGFLASERQSLRRLHASSGTRGKPTIALYTQSDLDLWADLCARSLACSGVRPGDFVQNSYGYGLFTGGLGIHYGIEKLGAVAVPASSGRTQQQIMLLQDFAVRALCCTPSYALTIADSIREQGHKLETAALAVGVFGAEPWTEQCREHIEERLHIKAYDIYGLSELLGPGIAVECASQNGLHIWEDHFLAEIIDPINGQPVPEGQQGELVLTTLTKEAMPLLRYRTGDACSFITGRCQCGRTMRRISRIQGRFDDMLIVRGVNVYPSEVEAILFACDELSPQYQIVITREKALDSLLIRVELSHETHAAWHAANSFELNSRRFQQELSESLREKLGLTAAVELLESNILPRSEGKAVRILDLRNS